MPTGERELDREGLRERLLAHADTLDRWASTPGGALLREAADALVRTTEPQPALSVREMVNAVRYNLSGDQTRPMIEVDEQSLTDLLESIISLVAEPQGERDQKRRLWVAQALVRYALGHANLGQTIDEVCEIVGLAAPPAPDMEQTNAFVCWECRVVTVRSGNGYKMRCESCNARGYVIPFILRWPSLPAPEPQGEADDPTDVQWITPRSRPAPPAPERDRKGLEDKMQQAAAWLDAVCDHTDDPDDLKGFKRTKALLREAVTAIERLQSWKKSALIELRKWDEVYTILGKPGGLGVSKADASRKEIERRLNKLI